jgi:hypothetical protein
MATTIMIQCKLNGNVIDIQDNSTQSGALLDAYPSKAPQSLTEPTTFAANQTWEVLPDPAGSRHFIIQNPATGHCIDIRGNSIDRGASLDAYPSKKSANQNQLWDFLPDPFGSGYFFIQNPQTGYVIEIKNESSKSGASLVVNPRRLFDNNFQLWAGVKQSWLPATFPALKLASPTADLKDTAQYVLLPTDQTKNLTGTTVILDIIEDLVADSFSVQINGNPPYPGPKGVTWNTQWMQFGLIMQNNSIILFNQLWPAKGPHPAGNPLPSKDETSGSMLQLENNTVPAGTRIVLTLSTDANDYVTGVSGKVYDKSGSSIGTPVNWPAIGQPTFHGGQVKESDLAPLGAFQVVVVGPPGGHAHFTSGTGTITVTCTPSISAQLSWPNRTDTGTGETSNCYYGKVQEGYFNQIAQPFGLPSPKITSVTGAYIFAGTGLLPNSKLTVRAIFANQTGATVPGTVFASVLSSQNDGSFSLGIEPQDLSFEYNLGTLTTTVTDADGNWAEGVIPTGTAFPQVTSTSSGLRQ